MSGLLDSLGNLTVTVDFSATLQPQVDALTGISGAVEALAEGPTALVDLEVSIDGLPAPPALDGLGNLAPALSGIVDLVPGDFSASLGGLISPLDGLAETLAGSPAGRITCAFDILREVLQLATQRGFGGPEGMPDGGVFGLQDLTDLSEIENALAEANTALDAFGPGFDAARVFQFLQDTALRFDRLLVRFPPIPVIQELAEALATVARWQGMTGDELTTHLAATITTAAKVIALPHDRVVRPVVAAANTVAAAERTLGDVNAELTALFAELGPQVEAGTARPAAVQLDRLDAAVGRIEALAAAMDPVTSPLAKSDDLDCDLIEARLITLRTLQPGCALQPFAVGIEAWLDGLPTAEADLFADIVQAIADFDLSVLTGPLQSIREAAEAAVAAFNDARAAVRDQLTALLDPVADALDSAIGAAQLAEIEAALAALPAQIQTFVDDQIVANLSPVRDGISEAVTVVSDLADNFDPETLTAPISDAIQQVGALVNNPEVEGAFADVEAALNQAIEAIGNFDLAPAADESITLIGGIEDELAEIDPNDIPDAVKPLIAQAVEVVASINFTAEVSAPIESSIQQAVQAGPDVILRAIEEGMTEVQVQLEGFRPSVIIADTLDTPFVEALAILDTVSPGALLGRIETALDGVQSRVQVLDVGAVIDPLTEVHTLIASEVEALRPSTLLKPVDDAIAAAIDKIYEVSGLDTVFDGINDILGEITRWINVIATVRDLLARVASMLEAPGEASSEIDTVVENAVAKLDEADLSGLAAAFDLAADAEHKSERDVVAGAIAGSYRAAGLAGPGIGASAETVRLSGLASAFPLEAAAGLRPGTGRERLIAAVTRLRAASAGISGTTAGWQTIGQRLVEKAGTIQVDLLDYYLAGQVEGRNVLEDFATPPSTNDALKDEVRAALTDGIGPPIGLILHAFGTFAPHARFIAQGLSDVLGAVHAQIDSLAGAGGVTGTVESVEEVVNLLREIDLSPVTDPLDALFARIEAAIDAISPEALRTPLEAARDAVAGLLDLSLLIDPADVEALETAYATAVAKLQTLSPSAAIGEPLDAEYEALLATILPVLELPGRLRAALLDAGLSLGVEVTAELTRVEVAFDEMLRAIPVRTGVSVSASASVSI